MNIVNFEDITTESALVEIEKESHKYEGLYVEMENKEERKYVKDKALLITGMLKRLDRARIDKSRDFKIKVESEAAKIKSRLEGANKPFTLLIDEYKIVREKQLVKEKARRDARLLMEQIPIDHNDALLMNKMFDFEKAEAIREQKERDDLIAKEAAAAAELRAKQAELDKIAIQEKAERDAKQAELDANAAEVKRISDVKAAEELATQRELDRQALIKKNEDDARKAVEADKKHVGAVRCEIKKHIMSAAGIDEKTAKKVVISLLKTSRIRVIY